MHVSNQHSVDRKLNIVISSHSVCVSICRAGKAYFMMVRSARWQWHHKHCEAGTRQARGPTGSSAGACGRRSPLPSCKVGSAQSVRTRCVPRILWPYSYSPDDSTTARAISAASNELTCTCATCCGFLPDSCKMAGLWPSGSVDDLCRRLVLYDYLPSKLEPAHWLGGSSPLFSIH